MSRIVLVTVCWAAALGALGACKRQAAAEALATQDPVEQQAAPLPEPLATLGWEAQVGQGVGLWVRVDAQQLLVISGGQVVRTYPCSTAAKGTGSQQGSEQTPLGWHEIGAKIGDGLPVGAILEERKWKGKVWQPGDRSDADLVLSRILRLRGLQKGYNLGGNVDSWSRYIYIHGTNDVEGLGCPTSHGCIRLSPSDVIELFDSVSVGCRVLITQQ
jgi:lipoprotein-anchoring transpeptidase ErfK/SrfK